MKHLVIFFLLLVQAVCTCVHAQHGRELPAETIIIPFKLQVGYNYTTVIQFPAPLYPGDRGTEQVIAQIESGVNNVLKLKAAVRGFAPTNLHIYTQDRKVYVFELTYADAPACTTFDLTRIDVYGNGKPVAPAAPLNDYQLANFAAHVKTFPAFLHRKVNKFSMEGQLNGIYSIAGLLLFDFSIANRSNLDYTIEFARFYIRDKKKIKNTSYQQQEINTRYQDPVSVIGGKKTTRYTLAIPQVTIPNGKVFYLELFEKNGGRHLVMRIKNRHLLKARILH